MPFESINQSINQSFVFSIASSSFNNSRFFLFWLSVYSSLVFNFSSFSFSFVQHSDPLCFPFTLHFTSFVLLISLFSFYPFSLLFPFYLFVLYLCVSLLHLSLKKTNNSFIHFLSIFPIFLPFTFFFLAFSLQSHFYFLSSIVDRYSSISSFSLYFLPYYRFSFIIRFFLTYTFSMFTFSWRDGVWNLWTRNLFTKIFSFWKSVILMRCINDKQSYWFFTKSAV